MPEAFGALGAFAGMHSAGSQGGLSRYTGQRQRSFAYQDSQRQDAEIKCAKSIVRADGLLNLHKSTQPHRTRRDDARPAAMISRRSNLQSSASEKIGATPVTKRLGVAALINAPAARHRQSFALSIICSLDLHSSFTIHSLLMS